ncbi:MAG: DNA recombination protein RmuC [Elusimicrobia bacterium]|nr:DNA recombination protein RmuC [Candidatus Obscuribacterium magneticum]
MTVGPTFILIITLLFCGAAVFLVWLLQKSKQESGAHLQDMLKQMLETQKQDTSLQLLQKEINSLREQMAKSLAESARLVSESQKSVGERLDKAAEVVGSVQKSLGALDTATKQVYDVGKDIATLQEILRAPKMRGAIGELFLGDLLAQILPPKHFTLQHTFKTGETVDAIVRLGRLVPVDAKFPLENFKRLVQSQDPQERTVARRKFVFDVRRHIDAIASKYILPDEGTYDFALMYIPAENVYYETIIKDDNTSDDDSLMTYAFSKRVVPVSPNSFYAYLHTISLGLRGLQIEENAKIIMDQLGRLQTDFVRFKDDFSLLGKHLSNSRTKYEDAERRLDRFEDKLLTTAGDKEEKALPLPEPSVPSLPAA